MPELTETIYIDRPPAEVQAFLIDPANPTLWQSNLVEFELLDDEIRKGSHVRGVSRVAGRRFEWKMEYAELDLGHRAVLRSIEAPFAFTVEETLVATGGGTTFTWHQTTESLGGFFGKLADPLVVRLYQRDVRSNLSNLKELLEA